MLVATSMFGSAPVAQGALPTIEVVGVSPVPGSEIDINKVPANVLSVGSDAFSHTKTPDLFQAMIQGIPFVSPSDQSGKPEMAVNRMTPMPNNPLFGPNAIGGAVSIDMKNGFNYHGEEAEVRGGSFGRAGVEAQAAVQNSNYSAYVAADTTHDDGWRDFSSSSQVNRIFGDLGAGGDQTEFHLQFTGADDKLGAVASTPIQLLDQRWSTAYTGPQTTHLQLAFLEATGRWKPTDTFSMQGIGYYRGLWQGHVDGNGTDGQPCDPSGPFPGKLCIGTRSVCSPGALPVRGRYD